MEDKASFVDLYQTLLSEHKKLKQKFDVKIVQLMGQDMNLRRNTDKFNKTPTAQKIGGEQFVTNGVVDPDFEARFKLLEEQMLQIRSGNNEYQAQIHEIMKSQNVTISKMD